MYEFYDSLEYFFYCYGLEILGMILVAAFGWLGHSAKKIYKNHIEKENGLLDSAAKMDIARAAVQFVEQVWKALHGPEKLRKALETAQTLLAKKGIDFDAEEMEILIEAAVAEFNDAFRKPLDDVNANAYRDNTEDPGEYIPGTIEELTAP